MKNEEFERMYTMLYDTALRSAFMQRQALYDKILNTPAVDLEKTALFSGVAALEVVRADVKANLDGMLKAFIEERLCGDSTAIEAVYKGAQQAGISGGGAYAVVHTAEELCKLARLCAGLEPCD